MTAPVGLLFLIYSLWLYKKRTHLVSAARLCGAMLQRARLCSTGRLLLRAVYGTSMHPAWLGDMPTHC